MQWQSLLAFLKNNQELAEADSICPGPTVRCLAGLLYDVKAVDIVAVYIAALLVIEKGVKGWPS